MRRQIVAEVTAKRELGGCGGFSQLENADTKADGF
jgi:hypothetical protein